MGNFPASAYTIASTVGTVSISTRSDPLPGFAVHREVGLVFANSESYSAFDQQKAKTRLAEALSLLSAEATKVGANVVLGMHVEVKEVGNQLAICSLYGTACVVGPAMIPK